MCFVNQSICSGCRIITETPTPKKPCTQTPDVLQHGCNGAKVVVEIEHTTPEFCSHCYKARIEQIKQYGQKREKELISEMKKHRYTPLQKELLMKRMEQEVIEELWKLDREWEKMWFV